MSKILLGLVGKKNSGKDTVGQLLATEMLRLGWRPIRLSFADDIKEEIAAATGGNIKTINANKQFVEVRRLLQWWGTDLRREQDLEYWLKKMRNKYEALPDNSFIYVTDCRFLNEAACIRVLGGSLCRVFRNVADDIIDKHVSETELNLIKFDHHLDNHGDMNALSLRVKQLVMVIRDKYKI